MMIDEAMIQEIVARHAPKLTAEAQVVIAPPVPIPVSNDVRFAAMPTAGKFESLVAGEQFQAACGMFNRMVAAAGILLDEPSDRVGEIILNGARRDLSQMWQFVNESQATDPDEFASAEFGLLCEVMASCLADHASRSDRRRQFFQSVAGELKATLLSRTATDWMLCK